MRTLSAIALVAATGFAQGAAAPYDEAANARAQIAVAQAQAQRDDREVLVVFGANWCPDCRVLDIAMHAAGTAAIVERSFDVVKVDVGRFDRNVDVAEAYGVPLKKGIPAVAVLSPQGKVLYLTRAGELADARQLGDAGIRDFLAKVASTSKEQRPPP